MTMNTIPVRTPMLSLLIAFCFAAPLRADAEEPGVVQSRELTRKESKEGDLEVATTYRGNAMILKRVTPPDKSMNTVYYVYLNGFEVLTYKVGPLGTEFRGAGSTRKLVKPDYTIKMAGDDEGRIRRITIYSPDFATTHDGFWLKAQELIPWSDAQLASWRKMRDETPKKSE